MSINQTKSGTTLLTETRDLMRRLHCSIHTERVYLATQANVAAATQHQALNALIFFV